MNSYNAAAWEMEYQNPSFITGHDQTQPTVLRFFKHLKKEHSLTLEGKCCLDLGSGLGRNTIYMAENGAQKATGIEVSHTAHQTALSRAKKSSTPSTIDLYCGSIAEPFSFLSEDSIDIILDVTASNALTQEERTQMLNNLDVVTKKGSFFYTRALCLEGDNNAKKLIKQFPGEEPNSYIMPGTELTETCFTPQSFKEIYEPHFKILKLFKESGYSVFNGQKYKRNFLIAYMQKI